MNAFFLSFIGVWKRWSNYIFNMKRGFIENVLRSTLSYPNETSKECIQFLIDRLKYDPYLDPIQDIARCQCITKIRYDKHLILITCRWKNNLNVINTSGKFPSFNCHTLTKVSSLTDKTRPVSGAMSMAFTHLAWAFIVAASLAVLAQYKRICPSP